MGLIPVHMEIVPVQTLPPITEWKHVAVIANSDPFPVVIPMSPLQFEIGEELRRLLWGKKKIGLHLLITLNDSSKTNIRTDAWLMEK